MLILISYDLEDDRQRQRLATLLEGHGERVQFSVFECRLSADEYAVLLKRVGELHAQYVDRQEAGRFSVRCYRLCSACEQRIDIVGEGEVTTDPGFYLI